MRKMELKDNKGITLIALVITIIVLLILAGISIAMLTGDNGIIKKATTAKEETIIAQYEEELNLVITEMRTDAIYKNEKFDMPYIIEKLPEYLEANGNTDYNWDIEDKNNEEPEGEYKGYSFYIDKNYIAHIKEKVKEGERPFSISIEEITTTSFKIIGNEEEIQRLNSTNYTYVIETETGEPIKYENKAETSYVITGLKAETQYKIYMLANDSEGNCIKKSKIKKVTTIYNPKINYSKEESLILSVEVEYPEIKNINTRNEYSVDGINYFEYSSPVQIKENCTFYARIWGVDLEEVVVDSQIDINNVVDEWEVYSCVSSSEYSLASRDVSKTYLYFNSSLGYGECIFSSSQPISMSGLEMDVYSDYEFDGRYIVGKGSKYTYNTSSQYNSVVGKYYIRPDGLLAREN